MGGLDFGLSLSLGIELPPWSGAAAALLIFAFCFPIFLRNARAARAKKMLKRSDLSSGAEREVFEKKAIDLVGTNPHGLLTLADTAQKLNRYTLANELLNRLPKTKKLIKRNIQCALTQSLCRNGKRV